MVSPSTTISALLVLSFLFPSVISQYDPQAALQYVYASALAYCDPATIQTWTCGQACKNLTGYSYFFGIDTPVQTNENVSFSMIYNTEIQQFITTFRGTDGNYQLYLETTDGSGVDYTIHEIPGALVQDYFQDRYINYIRSVLFTQLQEALNEFPNYLFVFTGHSLGAAFATLANHDVILSGLLQPSQTIMYNFGSPRVGNYIYAQNVVENLETIYRVVHYQDLIPHTPACYLNSTHGCTNVSYLDPDNEPGIFWAPWHIWTNIFYTDEASTNWVVCVGGEDPSCANQYDIDQCNVNDHMYYLNSHVVCDPLTSDEQTASILF